MRVLIVIGIFFFSSLTFGQIAFFHLYTNGGDDNAEGAAQLEDSSYVITGSSDSYPGGIGSQAFLMKIDSLGEPLWSKHYGGSELDQGKRVAYQQGFGFFIAGNTSSIGSGGYDFYLIKTDVNGVMEWEKAYGESEWERLYDAVMTRDTGMVMVGETLSNPTNNPDMYIVRTDKYGDTLWTKTMGGLGADGLRGVHRWDDSTFYVAGQTYVDDSSFTKAYIAKFHEDGTLLWSDTIGPNGNYFINDVSVSEDDVFCVGYRNGIASVDGNDLYFMRHNHTGAYLGETTHASIGDYKAHQATAYGVVDKRYVGWTFFDQWSQPDGDDLYITKMNYVFFVEDTPLHLHYYDPDIINDLIPTSDGGALAVGQTSSEAIGVHHAYVSKIGPNDLYAGYEAPHIVFGLLVDVQEQEIEDHLSVYPNPTSSAINIESSINDVIDVQIMTSLGQVLLTDSFQGKFSFDLSQFGNGIYFLKTTINGVSNVRKVVVK
jgi:hypothetical protein